MTRDFPNDDNGDVLRGMRARGIDLTMPRMVDFEHCFPDEASAHSFCEAVHGTVAEVVLFEPDPDSRRGWEVRCRQRLIPTHRAITETEERLGALAQAHGGYPDGWGSLSNADGTPAD